MEIHEVACPPSAPHRWRSSSVKGGSVGYVARDLEMRTYPKDYGMIEVMEEDIEVRPQVVLFLWSRLWKMFVVFCVERRRNSSEHPTNCEACNESEVG